MSEFNCLKIAFGDFQTPPELAREVCSFLKTQGIHPRTILEPTCGVGNFLGEAAEAWPHAHRLLGFEVNADYVARARARVQDPRAVFHVADFFATAWEKVLSGLPHPILVLGNPPWVTNAKMRSTGAANLPTKSNFQGHSGFDSITGKANFDISEWMLLKTLDWCERHQASIALLVKVSVARKVLSGAWKDQRRVGRAAIFRIDAKRWFGAAVDACLLTFFPSPAPETSCPIHPTLGSSESVVMGYKAGDVVSDIRKYEAVADLLGGSPARWRSGVKHDCS
ncbi:MAG: class I SAM-dependent methyltransferase, partial [Opitutaceae bacterium]